SSSAPYMKPARAQSSASGSRPGWRPRASFATTPPSTPTRPQPVICHGVQGPCPKNTFDTSPVIAPTANPGTGPSAQPANSALSVVGFTFGIGANAILLTTASADRVATSDTTRASGFD